MLENKERYWGNRPTVRSICVSVTSERKCIKISIWMEGSTYTWDLTRRNAPSWAEQYEIHRRVYSGCLQVYCQQAFGNLTRVGPKEFWGNRIMENFWDDHGWRLNVLLFLWLFLMELRGWDSGLLLKVRKNSHVAMLLCLCSRQMLLLEWSLVFRALQQLNPLFR